MARFVRGPTGRMYTLRGGFKNAGAGAAIVTGLKLIGGFIYNRYGDKVGRVVKDKAYEMADSAADTVIGGIKSLGGRSPRSYTLALPSSPKSFSSTMTKTGKPGRPKSYDTGVLNIGKGMTGSFSYFKGKAKGLSGNDVSRTTIYNVASGTMNTPTNTFGTQHVFDNLVSSADRKPYPHRDVFASAQTALFPSNTVNEYLYQLDSFRACMTFHNMDRVTVRMDIYDIVFAKDNASDDADGTSMYTKAIFAKALTKTSNSSTVDTAFPDVTPYRLPYFNNFYKILKRTRLYLAPGYTHQHTFESTGHYPMRETRINQVSQLGLKGMTYAPMVILESAPVRDAVDAAVTLGTPDIIFTTTLRSKWSGRAIGNKTFSIAATFDTTVAMENTRLTDSANLTASAPGDQANTDTTADNDT